MILTEIVHTNFREKITKIIIFVQYNSVDEKCLQKAFNVVCTALLKIYCLKFLIPTP